MKKRNTISNQKEYLFRYKLACFALILLLPCIFMGCSGNMPLVPEYNQEAEIKSIINNYWTALNNRQYSQAKSYCVKNGKFYTLAEEYQNLPYFESIKTEFSTVINRVNVIGISATVNTSLTIAATVCFEDICATDSETINNFSIELTKKSGQWKLQ